MVSNFWHIYINNINNINTIDNQKEEIRTLNNSLREKLQKNGNLKKVATDMEKLFEGARKELAAAVRNN